MVRTWMVQWYRDRCQAPSRAREPAIRACLPPCFVRLRFRNFPHTTVIQAKPFALLLYEDLLLHKRPDMLNHRT